MRNVRSAFATIGLALCLCASTASWGVRPILNVNDAPIVSAKPVPAAQVKSAIMTAGTSLGWQMAEVSPGLIQGTLNLRKHTAIVDIPYSATKYSIVYKSSINLDEKDGQIHRNYNSWVQNLSKKIDAELAHQ
jgi:hypothetical protein